MAKFPKQSMGVTEETFSFPSDPSSQWQEINPNKGNDDQGLRRAPVDTNLFGEAIPSSDWAAQESASRHAANDDRANIGQLLQALYARRLRLPYVMALVASVLWVAAGLIGIWLFRPELQSSTIASPRVDLAIMVGLIGVLVIPVLFFFVLAHMFRRSQDLRLVARSMAEVAMRLEQPEGAAIDSIMTVGQVIRREVVAMGDGVERALARATELEALVRNEVSALERTFNDNEVRIRDLLSELTSQRDTLVTQAEQVRNAIAGVHLDLSHDITSVGELVSDKVNEVAKRITHSLTEKGEHITRALGHAGDSMIDALSERASTLLDQLETTSESTATAISSASERLNESLSFKTEHVQEEFSELTERLQQLMSARLEQVVTGFNEKASVTLDSMNSRTEAFTATLIRTGMQMAESIGASTEEVNSTLRANGDSLILDISQRGADVVSKLEQTGRQMTDTMITRSNNVIETFRENAEALGNALNNRSDATKEMLVARLQAFENMFNRGGTELTEKVSRDTTTLGNLITSNIAEFERILKTYGGELTGRLSQRSQELTETMGGYVDSFDQRVMSHSNALAGTIDQRFAQFEQAIDSRVSNLTQSLMVGGKDIIDAIEHRIDGVASTINAHGKAAADNIGAKIEELDKALGARAMNVANNLDTRIGRFENLLVGRAEEVTGQIESRTKAAADMLNARMESLSQSIKTNSAEAERALNQVALSSTEAIRSSAGDAERTLLDVSEKVAQGFTGRADEIVRVLSQRSIEMATVLADKSSGVVAAISEKGVEFAQSITEATDHALQSIQEKGFAFTNTMLDNSSEIARLINSAGETATENVTRTVNELNQTSQHIINQSKESATSTVKELSETHSMLRADTGVMFERLREANIMLQEVLSGAHDNMSALESALMLRVSEFVNSMNEVSASTGALNERIDMTSRDFSEIALRVVTDLGQLADQFDSHGRALAKAVELIEISNRNTDDTMHHRREQLDTLVAMLDSRTEDLDQHLKRFASLLDESMESASNRAGEIARMMIESSGEGNHAISEQLDRVSDFAENERRRTAEAMHTVYDQCINDTRSLFGEANERFTELMHGMRQMTTDMQKEMEATRTELQRGMHELPQEISESAAQMRRIIVDQIEALSELNRIVARHGRTADGAEPIRRTVREEPALTVVGGRGDMPAPRPAPPPPRRESGNASTPAVMRRAEAPPPPPPPPPPAPTATTSNPAGRGWLSDLLTRASAESDEEPREFSRESARAPEERPPRHSIESLDSLSVDIARMIDHDAAIDLWDRYKRGERNVFTRKLYTLQGQKAFDEIRRKYHADREFKMTVDRYIAEFERLLEEVSRDDRDQMVARTYLSSETGKVYTMLAHAAGRIG
jgi:Apolipoprotein A1/A4/E domain